jgi:hypothetical protein
MRLYWKRNGHIGDKAGDSNNNNCSDVFFIHSISWRFSLGPLKRILLQQKNCISCRWFCNTSKIAPAIRQGHRPGGATVGPALSASTCCRPGLLPVGMQAIHVHIYVIRTFWMHLNIVQE